MLASDFTDTRFCSGEMLLQADISAVVRSPGRQANLPNNLTTHSHKF